MNGHLLPFGALRAFEAAARLMSFSKAADELKVDAGRDQPRDPRARTGSARQAVSTAEPFGRVDAVGPDAAAAAERLRHYGDVKVIDFTS